MSGIYLLISLFEKFNLFFLRPLFFEKKVVCQIVLWSIVLGLFNFSVIIIVGPFLKLFTQESRREILSLSDVAPERLLSLLGSYADFSFEAQSVVWLLPCFVVGIGVLTAVAQYNLRFLQQYLSIRAANSMRIRLFDTIIQLPFEVLRQRTPSEWMSLLLNDMYFYQNQFTQIAAGFFKNFAIILGAIPAMFFVSKKLFILYILMLPVLTVLFKFFGANLSKQGSVYQSLLRSVLNSLFDIRKRLSFIKVESTEEQAYLYYLQKDKNFSQKIKKVIFARNFISPFIEFFGYAVFSLMIYLFVNGSLDHMVSSVEAIQFVVAVGLSVKPLREAGTLYAQLQESLGVLTTVSGYVSGDSPRSCKGVPVEQSSVPSKEILGKKTGDRKTRGIDSLFIDQLSYKINKDIEINVSELALERGDMVAVIGASGSGKSTFLRLLAGIFKPEVFKASCSPNELANNSILVTQQPFVFSDSVANNVIYGTGTKNKELLERSLSYSRYQAMVKDRSIDQDYVIDFLRTELSGGQKQSLSLSRVFYQSKSLCLLDEPSSSYDLQNEAVLYENIKNHLSERITLMVTHRLHQLDLFSEVWFFDKGGIVCRGPHRQLLESSVAYRNFCSTYSNV